MSGTLYFGLMTDFILQNAKRICENWLKREWFSFGKASYRLEKNTEIYTKLTDSALFTSTVIIKFSHGKSVFFYLNLF